MRPTMHKNRNFMLMIVVAILALVVTGCGVIPPPGHKVIIRKPGGDDVIVSSGAYFAWGRDEVFLVPTMPKSFDNEWKILCADEINMDVVGRWLGAFEVTSTTVPALMESVGVKVMHINGREYQVLDLKSYYEDVIGGLYLEAAKAHISTFKTDNIREQRQEIGATVKLTLLERLLPMKLPVRTKDVLLMNLDFPEEITRKRKAIKDAELTDQENAALAKANVSAAERDAELQAKKGLALLVEANSKAAANYVLAASLTPEVLALRRIEAQERLASGPNNMAIVMPAEAMKGGSLPAAALVAQGLAELTTTIQDPEAAKARRIDAEARANALMLENMGISEKAKADRATRLKREAEEVAAEAEKKKKRKK